MKKYKIKFLIFLYQKIMVENLVFFNSFIRTNKIKRGKFPENLKFRKKQEKFQIKTQNKQEIFSLKINEREGGGKWAKHKLKEKL
jgi:hypothetical protein